MDVVRIVQRRRVTGSGARGVEVKYNVRTI
jgi:hypothetical protein